MWPNDTNSKLIRIEPSPRQVLDKYLLRRKGGRGDFGRWVDRREGRKQGEGREAGGRE